jgi:hypothetical protein
MTEQGIEQRTRRMLYQLSYPLEACTAPKNHGGAGAEDEKSLNVVAVAATA